MGRENEWQVFFFSVSFLLVIVVLTAIYASIAVQCSCIVKL